MTARLHKEATQTAPIQQNVHFSGMQLNSPVLTDSQLQSGSSTWCQKLHIIGDVCKRKSTIRIVFLYYFWQGSYNYMHVFSYGLGKARPKWQLKVDML